MRIQPPGSLAKVRASTLPSRFVGLSIHLPAFYLRSRSGRLERKRYIALHLVNFRWDNPTSAHYVNLEDAGARARVTYPQTVVTLCGITINALSASIDILGACVVNLADGG